MKRILIATDLSARSDRALQRAMLLAKEHDADLVVMHVAEDDLVDFAQRKAFVEAQVVALKLAKPAKCTVEVVPGRGSTEILRLADELDVDLIVLGIHRHPSHQGFGGTTAEQVVKQGAAPVLVVKDAVVHPYRRVLVPVDLSVHSRAALELAAGIAPQGEVYLVHATHAPFTGFLGPDTIHDLVRNEQERFSVMLEVDMRELRTKLGDRAPRFEVILDVGDVRQVLRSEIDRLKPDIVVLGTHARSGISYAVLGSVAEDMLSDAPVDVLAAKAW